MNGLVKEEQEETKLGDFCLHHVTRGDCDVGKYCECDEPIPSQAYYGCAYGPCEGHKCERCGQFL